MSKTPQTPKQPSFKKEFTRQLTDKISAQLSDLKMVYGEEKFSSRLRKAVKILAAGVKEKSYKKKLES